MLKVNNIKVEPLPRREHRQLRITLGGKRERGAVKKRQSLFFFIISHFISHHVLDLCSSKQNFFGKEKASYFQTSRHPKNV